MDQIQAASTSMNRLYEQQARITDAAMKNAGTNTKNLFGISAFGFGLPAVFQTSGQKEAVKAMEQYDQLMPSLTNIAKAIEKALDQVYTSDGTSPATKAAHEYDKEKANSIVENNAPLVKKAKGEGMFSD